MGKATQRRDKRKATGPWKKGKGGAGQHSHSVLDEAQVIQKKAERSSARGEYTEEAHSLFARAIDAYKQALSSTDVTLDRGSALRGLADCYLLSAELLADSTRFANSQNEEVNIKQQVQATCKEAFSLYLQIQPENAQTISEDICMNTANALFILAENTDFPSSLEIYDRCIAEYNRIPNVSSDILLNKGDVLQRRAELARCETTFQEAIKIYESCCSMTDSSRGDDLISLLEHWGGCLLSAAQIFPHVRQASLEQALAHLRTAIEMDPSSTTAMNAMGDVLVYKSEDTSLNVGDRIKCLDDALQFGYLAALRVDRHNLDGAVGYAEANFSLGKLNQQIGNQVRMLECFQLSASKYVGIIEDKKLWRGFGTCSERSDFLFNCACSLATISKADDAILALKQCFGYGFVTADDVLSDPDLEIVHGLFLQKS